KRKASGQGTPRKKQKKNSPLTPKMVQPKNALMQLNELKPGLKYSVESQEGPAHQPSFVVSVDVDGQTFTGRGQSKQLAKHAAAQAALKSFVHADFTSDEVEQEEGAGIFSKFSSGAAAIAEFHRDQLKRFSADGEDDSPGGASAKKASRAAEEADKKNPVMLLNELQPGLEYTLVAENAAVPTQRFTMAVTVANGDVYEGCGSNKRLAKAAAARSALLKLYNIMANPSGVVHCGETGVKVGTLAQALADRLGGRVNEALQKVGPPRSSRGDGGGGVPGPSGKTMLFFGFLGRSKHLIGQLIKQNGVEALRGCGRTLKGIVRSKPEVLKGACKAKDADLASEAAPKYTKRHLGTHVSGSSGSVMRLRVVPSEAMSARVEDKRRIRAAEGSKRVPERCLTSVALPRRLGPVMQTWDGVLHGQQRLLTMSCSDKLARWNVLGLQGSLLSLFMEPVYLESVVLGSLYHPGHMQRAMWGRLEAQLALDEGGPFQLHRPLLGAISSPESRQVNKSPNFSINWTVGCEGPEVVNASTGKAEDGQVSRLSKRSLFARFCRLWGRVAAMESQDPAQPPRLYADAKKSAGLYQEAKAKVSEAFSASGLGTWVSKPIEADEFELVF
ncbi:unnamed protein product, partial [Ixodes persulcatus]